MFLPTFAAVNAAGGQHSVCEDNNFSRVDNQTYSIWTLMRTVRPKKALGQHFLRDMDIAQRIAGTVDVRADLPILEIGPGTGVLTQFLSQ